jgi:hypothetical protein
MESIVKATRILHRLLENGELSEDQDRDMYLELKDPEIRAVMAVFEDEMEFRLVDAPTACYLSPNADNDLFGFQGRDFRRWFGTDGLKADGFLLCHIIMILLDLFYGGHNQNPKQREFLRVVALVEEVSRRFEEVLKEPEKAAVLEEQVSLNFVRIAELWSAKQAFEDGRRKTKEGTVMNVLNLLTEQKLVRLTEDEREIRPTRKLDDLMLHWFLSDARVQEIQSVFRS